MAAKGNGGGPKPPTKGPGLLTLEGMWEEDLAHTESVRPLAELLRLTGHASHAPVRDVTSRAELDRYLELWLQGDATELPVLYLACHGDAGTLWFGGDAEVSLNELALLIDGRGAGRILHIGACGVLDVGESVLQSFCRRSGLKGLTGYTETIDWTESAAFDLIVLGELVHAPSIVPLFKRMSLSFPDLVQRLGVRMATKTWASPANP